MTTASQGTDLLDLLVQFKSELAETHQPAVAHLQQGLDASVESTGQVLDQLEAALDHLHASALQQIQQLSDKLHAGFQQTTEAAKALHQEVDALTHEIDGYAAKVGDATRAIKSTHDTLSHALDQAESVAKQHGDQAVQTLSTWTAQIVSGLADLEQHHGDIGHALEAIVQSSDKHFGDIHQGFEQLVQGAEQHVQAVGQQVTSHVADAASHTDQTYHQDAASRLQGGVQQVLGVVQAFSDAGHAVGEVFNGTTGQVIQKVEQIANLLKQIEPLIALVKAL